MPLHMIAGGLWVSRVGGVGLRDGVSVSLWAKSGGRYFLGKCRQKLLGGKYKAGLADGCSGCS